MDAFAMSLLGGSKTPLKKSMFLKKAGMSFKRENTASRDSISDQNIEQRMKKTSTIELMRHVKELIRYLKVSVSRMVDDDSPNTPPARKVFFKAFSQKFKNLLGKPSGGSRSPTLSSNDD